MLELGKCWANSLEPGAVVFLGGELGAGKTTLARGMLNGLGHNGIVSSPTYTLIEHYSLPRGEVYHLDLYRLEHPSELEMTGLRDRLDGSCILLVEWAERGAGQIPAPTFKVDIRYHEQGRMVEVQSAAPDVPLQLEQSVC